MDPYDELADFLARGPSTREIVAFRASEESSRLFEDLVRKQKTERLTDAEHETVERFFEVERLVRLVKAKARRLLAADGERTASGVEADPGPVERAGLAAEAADVLADPRLTGRETFPPLADTALAESTAFAATRALVEQGERHLAERFATHLAEVLPRAEVGTLIDEILAWDEPHIALRVAKRAAQRGWELHRGYFPVTDLAEIGGASPVLSLAIARRESEFDPVVMSHAGARGLMQLMPGTARAMAGVLGEPFALPRLTVDPDYNARLGNAYLTRLESEFGPSAILVPAAYNAGPSRAHRWTARLGDPSDPSVDVVNWIEDVPFAETRNYIMRVSESLLPYEARLTGEAGPVRLSRWLREGYADLRPVEAPQAVRATRSP